ncbi:MAG: hypothetical protein HOP03_17990 [Lysobacter sp.]|nr:hypothetical protein [Lysobacter sp.]
MTRILRFRAPIALLSAGWLVPMWLGVSTMLDFVELELWPLLLQQPKLNSFPFIDFAGKCFAVAFLWLGLAVAGWAWVAVAALQRTKGR